MIGLVFILFCMLLWLSQRLWGSFIGSKMPKSWESYLVIALAFWILSSTITESAHFIVYTLIGTLLVRSYPRFAIQYQERQKKRKLEQQLLPYFEMLLSSVHAGHGIETAIEESVEHTQMPLKSLLLNIRRQLKLGGRIEEIMSLEAKNIELSSFTLFSQFVVLSKKSGSPLSKGLKKAIEILKQKAALRRRLLSLTAQGKAQGWVCICIPILMILGMYFFMPGHLTPLFQHPAGLPILIVSSLALALGSFWIHRIASLELIP